MCLAVAGNDATDSEGKRDMSKSLSIVAIVLLTGMIIASAVFLYRNSYVPYVPRVRLSYDDPDHKFVDDPSLLTPDHIQKMVQNFGEGSKLYKLEDGELLIRRHLANDKDLLRNLTKKAL